MYNYDPEITKKLKDTMRREVGKQRNAISVPNQIFYSRLIFEKIRSKLFYQRATNILLYSNFGSEVRTDEFLQVCLQDGKKVFYPKTSTGDCSMEFYEIRSLLDLNTGNYGIREPYGFNRAYNGRMQASASDTMMIVPGIAFSPDGYRLGYGKGYYDRYLSHFTNIFKCGVCFDLQMQTAVPHDHFDIKMDAIVTEGNIWVREGVTGAGWNLTSM